MAQDRVDDDEIPLTHEFLAMMLGTRRASVTDALQVLVGFGTIDRKRGRILVRDRLGLEKTAGDCYGLPESELARVGLLGVIRSLQNLPEVAPSQNVPEIAAP